MEVWGRIQPAYWGLFDASTSQFTATIGARKRVLFDSFGGWMVFLILWLLTAGAFWILYLLWLLIRTEVSSGPAYAATIIATPERDGRTRVTIQANRDDWQEALDSWLTREFPEAV
jgi:hypothetical protein